MKNIYFRGAGTASAGARCERMLWDNRLAGIGERDRGVRHDSRGADFSLLLVRPQGVVGLADKLGHNGLVVAEART